MLLVLMTVCPNCWKNSMPSENIFRIQYVTKTHVNISIIIIIIFNLGVCSCHSVHVELREPLVEAQSLLPPSESCKWLLSSGLATMCLCWLSYFTSSEYILCLFVFYFLGGSEDWTQSLMCAKQVFFSLSFTTSTSEDTLNKISSETNITNTRLTLKNTKGLLWVGERLFKMEAWRCRKYKYTGRSQLYKSSYLMESRIYKN